MGHEGCEAYVQTNLKSSSLAVWAISTYLSILGQIDLERLGVIFEA